MANIAFIGLGTMGGPMAGHLARAGHRLGVFNRTMARAGLWAAHHEGEVAVSPAQAAREADLVISCVSDDEALTAVTLGPDGAFATMRPGTLFIDHSSVSARLARHLFAEGEQRGLHCVDAPVSGGPEEAEKGTLSIVCGGTDPAVAAARLALQAYAAQVVHIGPAGAGQTAKMAEQIGAAARMQGLTEAMRFARAAGLDLGALGEALFGGAAGDRAIHRRWDTMTAMSAMTGDAPEGSLTAGRMRRDLGHALDEARANGAALPLTALIDQFCAEGRAMGSTRPDSAACTPEMTKP